MDDITAAVNDVLPAAKFQIFSGILKASRSAADGKMRLHGVASSTTRDLHGDTMDASALEDMERAANNNLTIFLNHSYEVPEDVAGSVESARMQTRGVDHLGNPNYDLDFNVVINDANPRAVKAFEAIERGTKLGLSIGAMIPDGGAVRDKKSGTYLIQHVDLLETSLVGIPANPRSWVEYAVKSIKGWDAVAKAATVPLGSPTLTLDGNSYTISGTVDGISVNGNPADVTTSTSTTAKATTWIETRDGDRIVIGDPDEPTDGTVENDVEPDITDAASCADCKPGQPCSAHKSIEPDVQDASVTIIQIDTDDSSSSSDASSGDGSQGGLSTDPDDGYAASGDVAVTASVEPGTIREVLSLLTQATGELVSVNKELAEVRAQLTITERERDDAVTTSQRVLAETKEILDKVADTPLMRRAVVQEAQQELNHRFKGYLSDDFLKMLES